MIRRTLLFLPGNNPAMILSADVLGADSVILDLEDAVSLTEKDSARILVESALNTLQFEDVETIVRINPTDSPYWKDDLELIVRSTPDTILLPKANVNSVKAVDAYMSELEEKYKLKKRLPLILLVETAFGIETIYDTILASDRTIGVMLGGEDLTSDLEVVRTREGQEIEYARSRVVMACKAANVLAIDTPFTDVDDMEGLKLDTEHAKALGFKSKAVINPRQVDIIHEVLAPSQAEIEFAMGVMIAQEEATKEGLGVFSYQGKMVDLPIINRAKKTLNLARKLRLIDHE